MKCQHCRNNEATVHLVEMNDGRRRDLWLCSECADAEQWRRLDSAGQPGSPDDQKLDPEDHIAGNKDFDSMLKFLGQPAPESEKLFLKTACPHCGQTWKEVQESGQVGCARCYTAFRKLLLPMLAAFHRHATHLGRSPQARSGGGNHLVETSRLRVAMEKAIACEDFEEAAKLRDQLHALDQRMKKGAEDE